MNAIALPDGRLSVPVSDMTTVEERLAAMQRAGIWTPEQAARFDALRRTEHALVRNDGAAGERWPCGRCGVKHEFFTLMCTPRPYRGLMDGLHAYWANVGAINDADLSPTQREAMDTLRPIFGNRPATLGDRHPNTAAQITVNPRDILIGSTLLGAIEPISRQRAILYAEAINFKARQRVVVL